MNFMHTRAARLQDYLTSRMPAALEMLRSMVEINSFTGNPDGVNQLGRLTAECFAPWGFEPEFVPSDEPNRGHHLVLTRPGRSAASIALVSHLDTVFPPEEEVRNGFKWSVEGDRIYGPGTNDVKGGTVMMWLVLSGLREISPEEFDAITWKLFWNSREEEISPDFARVCLDRFSPETIANLIFESEGRMGEERLMVVARKGRCEWRVKVHGRGAHAGSMAGHGANAVVQLARLVGLIAGLNDVSAGLSFNVARFSGGSALNRVPHEAFAEGEFRAFDPMVYARAREQLLALSGEGDVRSSEDDFTCQVDAEVTGETPAWPRNEPTDHLAEVWAEVGKAIDTAVNVEERGGLSDGNRLWQAVPTLDGLGPWGDHAHCSERSADGSKMPEYVEISGFLPKATLNVLAILRLIESRSGAAAGLASAMRDSQAHSP
jgi:glutamate carboxypeptidase